MTMHRLLLFLLTILLLIAKPLSGQSAAPLEQLKVITPENIDNLTELARYGSGTIDAVAWAGDILAVGGTLGVWLYDADALDQPPRLLPTLYQPVDKRLVALSADGRRVAALDDTELRVWDTTTGAEIAVFAAAAAFSDLALNADGTKIVGVEYLGYPDYQLTVTAWQVDSGEQIAQQRLTTNPPPSQVTFTPDGEGVALLMIHSVLLLDLQTETYEVRCADQQPWYIGMSFNADGQELRLISDRGVHHWNLADDELIEMWTFPSDIRAANLSPYQRGLALVVSYSDVVSVWHHEQPDELTDLPALTRIAALVLAPDGERIAGITWDGQLTVVETSTGTAIMTDSAHLTLSDMALFPDDRTLARGAGNHIELWDLATGTHRVIETGFDLLTSVAVLPDGEQLLYVGVNFLGAAWTDGRETAITLLNLTTNETRVNLEPGEFWYATLAPDGTLIASVDAITGDIYEWETEQFGRGYGHRFVDHDLTSLITYSPANHLLVVGFIGENRLLIDRATGAREEFSFGEGIRDLIFSPDGHLRVLLLESGGSGNQFLTGIEGDDPYSTQNTVSFEWNPRYVDQVTLTSPRFNPTGSLIACLANGELTVYDAATRAIVFHQPFYDNKERIGGRLAFSSDGRFIVTVTSDGLIRAWGVPEV